MTDCVLFCNLKCSVMLSLFTNYNYKACNKGSTCVYMYKVNFCAYILVIYLLSQMCVTVSLNYSVRLVLDNSNNKTTESISIIH